MPLYVFRCSTCGRTEEVLQSYTAPPPVCRSTDHPFGSTTMERIYSVSAITSVDSPDIRSYRQDGMRITTVDRRRRRERLE